MNNLNNSILVVIFLCVSFSLTGQVPKGYYADINGKSGAELKTALYNIVKEPDVLPYSRLWQAFEVTDTRKDNTVWDIYSENLEVGALYYYDFKNNRCGLSRKEGDCYNREHTLPRSWFNDTPYMDSDLFHIYPTDGYVNNRRSNLPYGEVGITMWESSNGSKIGQNTFGSYTKTVFEPVDEYKGDLARTYFYLVTAYEDYLPGWSSEQAGGSKYPGLSDWSVELLLKWHHEDPVSIKEVRRNEEVYKLQGNRNPFIDYPDLAEHVWGTTSEIPFNLNMHVDSYMLIECSPFERWLESLKGYINKEKE